MSNSKAHGGEMYWLSYPEGLHSFGRAMEEPHFAFDNETPKHQRFVQGFQIASRLVNCGEYLAFIQDGGYDNADLWLSEGRAHVLNNAWQCPPYWLAPQDPRAPSDHWQVFGLNGVQALDPQAPVCNLSFYEAAAFAQWAGARLPTEFEWELASANPHMHDLHGQVWQWTRSAYEPYPGFVPASGAVREYNGKFMVGQQCCAAAAWPHRRTTVGTTTAIFAPRTYAGSSAVCAWPKIYNHRT
jgi:ergothioneine biosynthesis protein EgtB